MKYRRKRLLLLKKKHIVIICAVLFAALAVFVISRITAAGRERAAQEAAVQSRLDAGMVRIGLRGDLSSLCTLNPDTGEYEGLEKDGADALVARVFGGDILVEYVEVNSRTKDALLKIGDVDFSLGASLDTDERGICYTSSYYADACAFLVTEGAMTSQQGLAGGVIAVVSGSTPAQKSTKDTKKMKLDDYLAAAGIAATVKEYASYPEAMDALAAGQVNGVCASEINLKIFGRAGMLLLSERFMPNRYRVQFASADSPLCAVFTREIEALRADGTLASLAEKWNLLDYSGLKDM